MQNTECSAEDEYVRSSPYVVRGTKYEIRSDRVGGSTRRCSEALQMSRSFGSMPTFQMMMT